MRLTSTGAERVFECISIYETKLGEPVLNMTELENFQFEQQDFEGSVVLSIDEASQICAAMNPGPSDIKWRNLLEHRINEATK